MKILAAIVISLLFSSCKQNKALFIEKNPKETGIHFMNSVVENELLNFFTYQYIYNGAGVAVGDIDNDGWEDIFFVSNMKGGNKLYRNKHNFQFDDITAIASVKGRSDWSTGVTMVDINGDGWLDIYVSTVSIDGLLNSSNELYINNKNGSFTESANEYGLNFKGHCTQSSFFDFDNDGDLDCLLLNHSREYAGDYQTSQLRKKMDAQSGEKLLQNNNGKFTDVTAKAGLISSSLTYGLGAAIGDINNDGWMDIYISNDFKENDYCYVNNGDGSFTEQSSLLFGHNSRFSMGNDMADINNDGWPEIISLDMLAPDEKILKSSAGDDDIDVYAYKQQFGFHYQYTKNCLQQNVDGRYFIDAGYQKGIAATDWSWAPLFADFNNDGNKDLFISNGYKYRANDLDFSLFLHEETSRLKQRNQPVSKVALIKQMPKGNVADYFYLQDRQGNFTDASTAAGFTKPTLSNGAAYADLDNDGLMDLIVNRMDGAAGIYQNKMPVNNFLGIKLNGRPGNTCGIGASVYIYSKQGMQLYHQSLSRGFMSSVSPLMHIGLGNETVIDSLVVLWPGGRGQKLLNVKTNVSIELDENNAIADFARPLLKKSIDDKWEDITASCGINVTHKEDAFEDLSVQPFLPHSIATQGPKAAVADVNGDGLQDFFICAAKGQKAELFIQSNQSTFNQSAQACLTADSMLEQTDAIFFDADRDSDMDLYICTGGNEFYGSSPLLKDRLYVNDGKGNFSLSNGLPNFYENKSCAAACDFDKDGDMDLFVGGRANARMYGYIPASVILENDGKGNFREITEQQGKGLQYPGMVTSACWSDIDKDGWIDLIVAGEWMPITVFKNNKGKLQRQDQQALRQSNGWWNCMYKSDIDGDGDDDFLLGNWGTNSKMLASAAHPLTVYLSDWAGNGQVDPVLCIFKNGHYYPFLGKADLEKRLPYLKKKYLKYADIAGKPVEDLFGREAINKSKKLEAYTLRSSILWNNDGQLTLQPLPSFLQTAPIFSFARFQNNKGKINFIAAGNFYDVLPYEGRYDAMLPTVFAFEKTNVIDNGYIMQKGAVRSIQPIALNNKHPSMLLAKNNEGLVLISYTE